MAAKDSFTRKRSHGFGDKFTYMAHFEKSSALEAARMLLGIYDIPSELSNRVYTLISRFYGEFSKQASHLGKVDSQSDFVNACKDRYQDLTKLNGVICTDARDLEEVNVFVELKSGPRCFSGRWDRRHHVYGLAADETVYDLWSISERPGCYKWLFLADLVLIAWAAEADPDQYPSAWNYAAWCSSVICSIGRIYEDIRPNRAYVGFTEEQSLSRLQADHDLDHDSYHYQSLLQVIDDIKEGTKPYIRDIARAIVRADLKAHTQYELSDYHVSMRKTGSTYKGKSYPGLYSSLFEADIPTPQSEAFDQYTGYTSHYNKSYQDGVNQPGAKTITIEQHKIDRRTIHMGDNPRQDRLNYVHRRMQKILDLLPEDCTRSQSRGVDFAQEVTNPAYRAQFSNNIYSLDISKATDTIDLEFQKICLSAIFPKEVVEYWIDISLKPRIFKLTSGEEVQYQQSCGQAQGFKSSFPSFAWCHHIIMRILMYESELENSDPRKFYRVLGDDSIISCYDPNEEILDRYIDICSWINWSTNRSKGYIAHAKEPYAFAEFAKKRVLNGKVNTPIPSKLILNAEKTANGTIGLFQWISKHYGSLSIREVWAESPSLSSMYSDEEISKVIWMAESGVLPCFDGWKEYEENNFRSYTSEELLVILMSYFLVKLKSTLVDQLLPDTLREVTLGGFDESKLSYLMNTEDENELFDLADDPDNKYYQLIQINSDMIDYINHILFSDRPSPISNAWVQLSLELEPDEESRIFQCLEICDNFSHGNLTTNPESAYRIFDEVIRILTRFNPRGDSRVTFQNGTLWTPVIQKLDELLDMRILTSVDLR